MSTRLNRKALSFKLITPYTDHIENSFLLLKDMKWKQIEDFVPLVALSSKEIIKLQGFELNGIRNRVYELAAELQVSLL